METVEQFREEQSKVVEILQRLLKFVQDGQKFGVRVDDNLISKITTGIDEEKSKKLKVALIGGFSEGKTSIAAAWSGNYDPEIFAHLARTSVIVEEFLLLSIALL